jgi:hypothetical protein
MPTAPSGAVALSSSVMPACTLRILAGVAEKIQEMRSSFYSPDRPTAVVPTP